MSEQAQKQQKIQEGYQNAVNAGNTMMTQKQYQKAREAFQQALTFKPDDVLLKIKYQKPTTSFVRNRRNRKHFRQRNTV